MNYIYHIDKLDKNKEYTYADYLTWQFRERVELIMGKMFRMSPAPSSLHQQIVSSLHGTIYQQLKRKKCKVFPAPFDVVLPSPSGLLNTVVQPDISIICDNSKITEKGCVGPPDLIIEVASKSTIKKDLHEKYKLYEQAGVREYWYVYPHDRSLIIFTLNEGIYSASKPLTKGDTAISAITGLRIELDDIFLDAAEEPEEFYGTEMNRI